MFTLNSNHFLSVCVFDLIKQAIGLYSKTVQASHTLSDKQEGGKQLIWRPSAH